MKKLQYSIGLFALFLSASCKDDNQQKEYGNIVRIKTYMYDSCEYVVTNEYLNGASIAHKGNCIYCAKRNKLKSYKN